MRNRFLHFLGVETGEESMVSLLLTQSVFLGLFYGAFDISAHSLFLAVFDETIMARAYVISGLVGIVLTSGYSFIQARMQFRNFAVLNLLFVTLLTLLMWVLLITSSSRAVIFTVFVMMGPLNILAMLGFWGTTGRLFTLRQGKRLFGLVDAGQIFGIIVSSYAIPVLLAFGFNTHNIIMLSAIALAAATILQYSLARQYTIGDTVSVRKGSVKAALSLFRKDSYVLNMGLFVALSVMTAFFVQYSFMAVTREQYPQEADMARFLGLFIGSMMIFTLFLKTFLFSYLIRNYGLKVLLLLPPLLLLIFTAGAALTGVFLGYTPGSGGFMLFFLVLALSRLFSKSLRDAVETPSFKVIYQTLNERVRYDVQSIVDGTVNEISALASGLILSGLGILVLGKLIHFSWVLLAVTALWGYFGFRLYFEYRKSIVRSLDEASSGKATIAVVSQGRYGKFHARMIIRYNYLRLICSDFSSLERYEGPELAEELIRMAGEANDSNLVPVIKWIADNQRFDEELRNRSRKVAVTVSRSKVKQNDPFHMVPLSKEADDLLRSSRSPQPADLLRTLRDNSPASKRAAILSIGKYKMTEMLAEVCDSIGRQETAIEASQVLDQFGKDAYGELSRSFLRSSGNAPLMKNLLSILGRNCYDDANSLIYQMLRANSRSVKRKAAEILVAAGYQVPDNDRDKMHQHISEIIGIITWYIQSSVTLKRSGNTILAESVESEKEWWYDFLFLLLSLLYDPQYIVKIRENLDKETVESVNFALEMIDIVVDDSIKARVSYCVDIADDEEKLRSLYQFYPGYIPTYEELVVDIINRDYNLTTLWTKAVAAGSLTDLNDSSSSALTLSALLFSPNRLLVEEAARLAVNLKPDLLDEVFDRLPGDNRIIVGQVKSGLLKSEHLITSKVGFLKLMEVKLPNDDLVALADIMEYIPEEEMTVARNDDMFLLYVSNQQADKVTVRFVRAGTPFELFDTEVPGPCYMITAGNLVGFLSSDKEYLEAITDITNKVVDN